MNITRHLVDLGQSIWLDNISRELLNDGRLGRYVREFAVTGLTSNPAIFSQAFAAGQAYDEAIARKSAAGRSGEALFFDLALEDLCQAADLLRPIHDASAGVDGWVSLEVSPLLADDTAATVKAAHELFARANRPNLFIKIPGNAAGLAAIEEAIFLGVPVNVTLLFSPGQYLAAAEAYMRGIERRLAAGLAPGVASVASIFVSRWDVAANPRVGPELQNRLGVAMASRVFAAYRELLVSDRWRQLGLAGTPLQRLLWASTGSKDAALGEDFYVAALASASTIDTLPEKTLLAFAARGRLDDGCGLDPESTAAIATIAGFAAAGVVAETLADELQKQGIETFTRAWHELLQGLAGKSALPGVPAAA